MMRYLRCLLVGQLVLAATCGGFLQDMALAKRCQGGNRWSTNAAVLSMAGPQQPQQPQPPQPSENKPPRFAQKAHSNKVLQTTPKPPKKKTPQQKVMSPSSSLSSSVVEETQTKPTSRRGRAPPTRIASSSSSSKSTSSSTSTSLPFNTEKSIEEMEDRLMKRWGTLEQPSSTGGGSGQLPNSLQRPVIDPWDMDTRQQRQPVVREFYDEDDEGFEIMELDDNNEDEDDGDWDDAEWEEEDGTPLKKDARMMITHLISPKPVGGSGSSSSSSSSTGRRGSLDQPSASLPIQPSYFFNPNKQVNSENTMAMSSPASSKELNSKSESSSNGVATTTTAPSNKTKRVQPPAAQPLVDINGDELLLTLQEAKRRFESTSTDEAVEAMTDAEEAPLVAYQQSSQLTWNSIGITSELLLQNLNAMYCSNPLVVQQKTIPHVLTGSDVLVGMYTGSGKTLSFLTPLIQRLLWQEDEDAGLSVLIVAPGRELASQIVSVARKLLEGTPHKVQLAIGGTTFGRNLEQIRKQKPNILVGTPGRIAELVVGKPGEKSGRLKINNLQTLVLDEFDALLEYKPHSEPTRAILQTLQRRHGTALQSILCSATASDLMDSPKVTQYLRPGFATALADDDDVFVTGSNANRPQVSKTVMHGVVHVPHKRFALDTIRRILHTEPVPQQILIFVESSHKVEIVVDKLGEQGIIAAPLHGGKNSDKIDRADVSKALREGFVGIVVATEMAARGLDAPLLTHVINMDLPTDASHYAHRAGRCGRGGRPGVVINMTTGPKERRVPLRFSDTLGIEMYTVEPRKGKLILVDPETQTLDES